MHDIRFIREQSSLFDQGLARRGLPPASHEILAVDADRRGLQTKMQELQARRNDVSKQIGDIKRQKGNADLLMQEVANLKENLTKLEEEEGKLGHTLEEILSAIPNLPANDVPEGKSEKDNKEIRRFGTPQPTPNAKEHFDIGEKLGLMDFNTAAKLSGARFTLLKGPLARLERAIGEFMLDTHTEEFGYTEISPPLLVNDASVYGVGQLPKFADDLFRTTNGLWLISTAEVPLTNIVQGMIVNKEDLPYRFTAKTPCFRSEAGAAGKDTRGMLRQHQFYKVELVSITRPDQSVAEHERMTECAETILKRLELPYRTIVLCTGDMGFGSRKTYDIEVWMPGQKNYREISSCSDCGDFQARRMNARCRGQNDKNTEFLHTLNGSGVAIGRCLIAILENYQQPDGSVIIPTALRRYMNGLERLEMKVVQ